MATETPVSPAIAFELRSALSNADLADQSAAAAAYGAAPFLVDNFGGAKIILRFDEHPPPHFMIKAAEDEGRYSILDCSRLTATPRVKRQERDIRKWWQKHRDRLVDEWNESRPADCPVGLINKKSLSWML